MINKITLKNVRLFSKLELNITSSNVLLLGNNAIGKTTILESIYLASLTKSHRTNYFKEIIKEKELFSDIKITTNEKIYRIVISNTGKMVSINNKEIKKISEYIGMLPTVFFTPYDLSIITDSPSIRRQFLNQEISQIYPNYIHNLNLFNKLYLERNNCLKILDIDSDTKILDVITNQLIDVSIKIINARTSFINELNEVVNLYHQKLNPNEIINIIYNPNLTISKIYDVFETKKKSDIISHQTNYGIQRDDIIFNINNKNAQKYASQGQIRSIILSVKLAICNIIYKYKKKYPILLLDDVLSELDKTRQNNLLNCLNDVGQVFITSTDSSEIDPNILKKYQIIKLKGVVNNE